MVGSDARRAASGEGVEDQGTGATARGDDVFQERLGLFAGVLPRVVMDRVELPRVGEWPLLGGKERASQAFEFLLQFVVLAPEYVVLGAKDVVLTLQEVMALRKRIGLSMIPCVLAELFVLFPGGKRPLVGAEEVGRHLGAGGGVRVLHREPCTPPLALQVGPQGLEHGASQLRAFGVVADLGARRGICSLIVLQTTKYDDFEAFLDQLKQVVTALNTATGGIVLQRIGLRYVDAITPTAGSSWKQYVQPSLAGFESELFDEQQALRLHQTVATTPAGTMLVRLHQNRDGNVLPPDLAGGQLKPRIESEKGSLTTLLDIDHFRRCQDVEFNNRIFDGALWELKNGAFAVFRDSLVTDFAIEAWK